jgi:type II secretion system protein H
VTAGAFSSSRHRGFTLLEMLVTLVVIAIAVAGTSLSLRPDEARQLAGEAERLALLLTQAREESELVGRALAWVATVDRYEFQRRELGGNGPVWTVMLDDDLLHPRGLPTGCQIHRIDADGRRIAHGERLLLDLLGPRAVRVELSLGQARSHIVATDAGFEVVAVPAADV